MAQGVRHLIAGEYSQFSGDFEDPALAVLGVAIYLEDALGIVLPAGVLDVEHLGTPEAVERTLTGLLGAP